jgi:hypothetical protein
VSTELPHVNDRQQILAHHAAGMPTIAEGRFSNRLSAHIKVIKDDLLIRRQLIQLLIKGCYYSVEEYMCDDFT